MAIGTIIASAAVYLIFMKKINRMAQGIAAGIAEFAKIATRGYREKRREKKSEK